MDAMQRRYERKIQRFEMKIKQQQDRFKLYKNTVEEELRIKDAVTNQQNKEFVK